MNRGALTPGRKETVTLSARSDCTHRGHGLYGSSIEDLLLAMESR